MERVASLKKNAGNPFKQTVFFLGPAAFYQFKQNRELTSTSRLHNLSACHCF